MSGGTWVPDGPVIRVTDVDVEVAHLSGPINVTGVYAEVAHLSGPINVTGVYVEVAYVPGTPDPPPPTGARRRCGMIMF